MSSPPSQGPVLIDPRTRFSDIKLELPPQASPVLQRDFAPGSKPDSGETSYKGHGRLAGRRALITGGDSGMGRAVVIAMAREGAKIAINYLPYEEPDAEDLSRFLAKEGIHITKLPGNLLDEEFCAELIWKAERALGGLDILVSNAGTTGGVLNDDITTLTTAQWDTTIRTNLYVGFWLTRAAVSFLPPGAAIIFTVSDVINYPTQGVHDYAASKGGLASLVKTLGMSLASKGIRVNGVAPGPVYTPILAEGGLTTEMLKEAAAVLPLGRPAQPVEMAPLFVDLADSTMTYTSGGIWSNSGAATSFRV